MESQTTEKTDSIEKENENEYLKKKREELKKAVLDFKNGKLTDVRIIFHIPEIKITDIKEHLFLIFQDILHKQPDIMRLPVIFEFPVVTVKKEILRGNLRQCISLPQAVIDDAAEWFDEIADQGFPMIKKSMMDSAEEIESI